MQRLNGNITSQDITSQLGKRPERHNQGATNILLLGSDTREGQSGPHIGHASGARSDTTVLLHLSEGREKATLVSIPRDSWVDIPSCKSDGGGTTGPQTNRFNTAYSIGGPACTIKTVESLTDVYVDHFVVVDFAGFQRMIDAMDGVDVCVEEAVQDSKSGLNLPAGHSEVGGRQALAFARARYSLGDGSDLSRIDRQQALMSAMIRKVKSTELLLNPKRLYSFLDAATKSITTDPGLASLNDMRKLAMSVKGMQTGQVRFVTVPNYIRADEATVAWDDSADDLWEALREDGPLPGEKTPTTGKKERPLTVDPSRVKVTVLNGSGEPGLAGTAAEDLKQAGFTVTGVGNADTFDYEHSVVRHDGAAEPARTLTSAVQGAEAETTPTGGDSLELVLGKDYAGVQTVTAGKRPPKPEPSPTESVDARKATERSCS